MATLKTKIVLRNDSAANWTTHNPILLKGEVGVENDTNYFKIGDGARNWADLPYANKYESSAPISAHYEIIATESQTDLEAIEAAIATPKFDDVAVVKRLIADDKYQRTAYVYDGANWLAFDGNYNAENVYFDENLIITSSVGNFEVDPAIGNTEIPLAGRNIRQAFDTIWSKENLNPTVQLPTLSIDFVSQEVSGEVGTTFTAPAATATVTFGSFEFGSKDSSNTEYPANAPSDVIFDNLTLGLAPTAEALGQAAQKASLKNFGESSPTKTVSLEGITGTFSDAPQVQKFSAIASHQASARKALTNLGNFVSTDGNPTSDFAAATHGIPAAELSSSAGSFTATGYRAWFAGGHNEKLTQSAITGSWVREHLQNKGQYPAEDTTLELTPGPDGAKCVLIAIPGTEKEYLTRAQLNSFADITINYTQNKFTLQVPDASGAAGTEVPYTVYFYQPAALGADEKHTIYLKGGKK